MGAIKWLAAATIALAVTVFGIGLAIGAVIIATVLKLIGIFGFIAAALTLMVKEKIDEKPEK
jgi:hypothetical protein